LLLACLLVCLPTPSFSLYFPQLTCPLFPEEDGEFLPLCVTEFAPDLFE
jgi:hypothetical protein